MQKEIEEAREALKKYVLWLRSQGRTEQTCRRYMSYVRRYLSYCLKQGLDWKRPDKSVIRDYLLWELQSKGTPDSLYPLVKALQRFYEFLGFKIKIKAPRRGKKLPVFLTEEELKRLLEAARQASYRDYVILRLLYVGALRVGEYEKLRPEDFDLDEGSVRIFGKGRKERVVFLDEGTVNAIRQVGLENVLGLSSRQVQRLIKRYALKAGIAKKVSPHTLRHSRATHLLKMGVNIRVVQELLGHESLRTTEIYTHVVQEDLRRAAEVVPV